jgi:hypothetical protein
MMASKALAEESITSDRVFFVASTKWHLIRDKAVDQNNILLFRKYAFPVVDDKQRVEMIDVKNVMSYGCQRNNRNYDFVAFHLPSWIHFSGIETDGWISQLDLRVSTDKLGFTAVGEYRKRELFIDLNEDFKDKLLKLIVSDQITIEFGPKNERIAIHQMHRTPSGGNVAGFLDDAVPMLMSALTNGKPGKIESLEAETILQKCLTFKKTGRY